MSLVSAGLDGTTVCLGTRFAGLQDASHDDHLPVACRQTRLRIKHGVCQVTRFRSKDVGKCKGVS